MLIKNQLLKEPVHSMNDLSDQLVRLFLQYPQSCGEQATKFMLEHHAEIHVDT